jgi:DNA (cytosine-5)-methyltransferase 1
LRFKSLAARAYYNEIDPFAADWLRNLILYGVIASGDVDTRSIEDVLPSDLHSYTQCHFFAGIGVWSYALRLAGWGDDQPVWTGSCPCQPFSQAGQGAGFTDERHLWPAWFHLIRERRPSIILGEQVASKAVLPWVDLVSNDLETASYAFGAADIAAASVGAPNIRQRIWWMADANKERRTEHSQLLWAGRGRQPSDMPEAAGNGATGGVADADGRYAGAEGLQRGREHGQQSADGSPCELGDACCKRSGRDTGAVLGAEGCTERRLWCVADELEPAGAAGDVGNSDDPGSQGRGERRDGANQRLTGPAGVADFWSAADWIPCRDGKWRPVEPGTFPLVNGAPSRVGRLRAYGNAINAEAAAEFIRAVMECRP